MSSSRFEATYLIETPLDPAHVAEVLAGEQSCGTFTRVEGETDALRERARATVESVELLDVAPAPSLPNGWMQRRGMFDQPQTWPANDEVRSSGKPSALPTSRTAPRAR